MSSRSHPILARFFVPVMVLAFAMLAAPAFAVKPYTDPKYRQPKATLKQGYSMGLDTRHQYRFKQGKNNGISHGGVAPQYHRTQFNYSASRSRPRR